MRFLRRFLLLVAPVVVVVGTLVLWGGFATRPVNPPLARYSDQQDLIALAFSGGGTRADIDSRWTALRTIRDSASFTKRTDLVLNYVVNAPDADIHVIDVSFQALKDKTERQYLNDLPTAFALPREAVDRLRAAASSIILESPDLRGVLKIEGRSILDPLKTATSQDKESHGKQGHWSYEGETGPAHWFELDPEFTACAKGKYEAPIDIVAAEQSDLPPLQFRYAASPLTIVDNGHTIMATYAPGSTLTIGNARYELQQFHFHRPSEELVHGRASTMAVHLVHEGARGHLAVVAVLLDQGRANPVIEKLWANLPREKEHPATLANVSIDANTLLPASHGYYTFTGSLTTPPCTEGVTWYVLKTPVEVSSEQIAAFAKLYPMNARPVQPLNGRKILETRK